MKDTDMVWGALLHLGSNMWDDFIEGPDDWAKSEAEVRLQSSPRMISRVSRNRSQGKKRVSMS